MTYKSMIIIDKAVKLSYFLYILWLRPIIYSTHLRVRDFRNALANNMTTRLDVHLIENAFLWSRIHSMLSRCFEYQSQMFQMFSFRVGIHRNVIQIDQYEFVDIWL